MLQFRSIAALGCIAAFAAGGVASLLFSRRAAGPSGQHGTVNTGARKNAGQPAIGELDPTAAQLMRVPTLENRLRLVKYLQEAAQTSPGATLLQLEALTEESIRVWTPREALLAFWSVWAFTDAEAAWQAAEQRADPELLDIVATALVEKNPRRVLDSPELIAWHPMARARLIGQLETPDAADLKEPGMALHWLRSRPFSAAALETVLAVPGMPRRELPGPWAPCRGE